MFTAIQSILQKKYQDRFFVFIAIKNITVKLCHRILEILGYRPYGIIKLLAKHPQDQISLNLAQCISAFSVPRWHDIGSRTDPYCQPGTLQGWRSTTNGAWNRFTIMRQEINQLGCCEITRGWSCDITDIHGFSNSKSELSSFASTDEMVEANSREMIDEITPENLKKILLHQEIRIIHSSKTSDHFARFLWDGRLWLMNDGGSHHTAAAKYISARTDQPVRLTGELRTYSLDKSAIESLRNDFEMFVISHNSEFFNQFFDEMQAFKATWLSHPLPSPYNDLLAILLPKNNSRSMRVSAEFHRASLLDLGEYLADLALKQRTTHADPA
jgi:hypothetical protein